MKLFLPDPGRNIRLWLNSFSTDFEPQALSHKEIRCTERVLFIRKRFLLYPLIVCDRLLIVAAVGPESMPYPDYQPLFPLLFRKKGNMEKRGG